MSSNKDSLVIVPKVNFEEKPIIVFIELTRACEYVCPHCRANTYTKPKPDELSRVDVLNLLHDITEFEKPYPLIVFTGGNPLLRDDLLEILSYGKSLDLPLALAPTVTPKLLNPELLREFKKLDVKLAISLDSSIEEIHNKIRLNILNINSWRLTIDLIKLLNEYGVKFQVNTLLCRLNIHNLTSLAKLALSIFRPFAKSVIVINFSTNISLPVNNILKSFFNDRMESRIRGWAKRGNR